MQNTTIRPGRAAVPLYGLRAAGCELPSSAPRTLKDATQEFEAQFVAKLMQSMRRTVPEGTLTGRGERLFREMLDEEWARGAAVGGRLGIGELLYQQLSPDARRET